jgi:hypothetical protein
VYGHIPDPIDRMLALALAAAAHQRDGDEPAAEAALAEVRAFAHRNQAPGVLRLATPSFTSVLPGPGPVHAA